MTHLSGKCRCGRIIHLPSGADYGDTWVCRKCGMTWILSHTGKPLETRSSKPPPKGGADKEPLPVSVLPHNKGGCLMFVITAILTWLLF